MTAKIIICDFADRAIRTAEAHPELESHRTGRAFLKAEIDRQLDELRPRRMPLWVAIVRGLVWGTIAMGGLLTLLAAAAWAGWQVLG